MHAWLAGDRRRPAAVVAKCGPPGVLWEEPGALYLTVQVRGRSGVVLAPALRASRPAGWLRMPAW